MQPTSEIYNQLVMSQNYHLETSLKVKVGSSYKTINEDKLMSMSVTRKAFQNNKPEVGCCVCGELNVTMMVPTFDIPKRAEMRPMVRLVSNEMDVCDDNNFLLDAKTERSTILDSTSGYIETYYFDNRVDLYEDKSLTVEFDYSVDGIATDNAEIFSKLNNSEVSPTDAFVVANSTSGHHIATFNVTHEQSVYSNSNIFDIGLRNSNSGAFFTVSNVKVYATMSEWIQKGVYYVDTRQVTNNSDQLDILTIHGYDSMIMMEQDYAKSTLSFPANDINVVREIASKVGVSVEAHTVEIIIKKYKVQAPTEYSYREVLGYIAGMYAGNFVMNDLGELQLVTIYELPPETSILIDEGGSYITVGTEEVVRILLSEEG